MSADRIESLAEMSTKMNEMAYDVGFIDGLDAAKRLVGANASIGPAFHFRRELPEYGLEKHYGPEPEHYAEVALSR